MIPGGILAKLSPHVLVLLDDPQEIVEPQKEEEDGEEGASRPIKKKPERRFLQPGG